MDTHETNDDADAARQSADEEVGGERRLRGVSGALITGIAVSWSLFQWVIARWEFLNSSLTRRIHLAFALLLIFWSFPLLKRLPRRLANVRGRCSRRILDSLTARDRIPLFDLFLGIAAALAVLYVVFNYRSIMSRAGMPTTTDIVVGMLLVLLLLEATRRVIGPVLSIVCIIFSMYLFFGPYAPAMLVARAISICRYVGQMVMEDEGIFGIPIYVSSNVVFLFVLFGAMLDRAGAGKYFIGLAMSLLGRFRGGPAKAAVMASMLTGTVSGSSIANIVTTGTFTIPMMKKVGYPPEKAAAIEVAASTDGQLAPPIMGAAAFIMAEYIPGINYIDVIKAAAIPAFASYATLFYITHLEACKLGLRGIPRNELPRFSTVFMSGLHYWLPIGFLLVQLIVLRHSPRLAAFHAVWVLALTMLVVKPVQAKGSGRPMLPALKDAIVDIFHALATGARTMLTVAVATAAAGIVVGVVTLGLGSKIGQMVEVVSGGNFMVLLIITAAACLILGMGLPTTATYIVMASLIAPVLVDVGLAQGVVVSLIAAHLFCFYFGILADDTPPVGLAAYAAAAIAKSKPIATGIQAFMYDIRTAILPFMFIFNGELLLLDITRWHQGILIFVMACAGSFAFAAAAQGWFAVRNRWYEVPPLLAVTVMLLIPGNVASWLGIPHGQRYWVYVMGLLLMAAVYGWQRWGRGAKRLTPNA